MFCVIEHVRFLLAIFIENCILAAFAIISELISFIIFVVLVLLFPLFECFFFGGTFLEEVDDVDEDEVFFFKGGMFLKALLA